MATSMNFLCPLVGGKGPTIYVNPPHVERAGHGVQLVSWSMDDVAEFLTYVKGFDKIFRFMLHGGQ